VVEIVTIGMEEMLSSLAKLPSIFVSGPSPFISLLFAADSQNIVASITK